jgi:hypothetical protein
MRLLKDNINCKPGGRYGEMGADFISGIGMKKSPIGRNDFVRPLHNLPKFVPGYFIAKARWMSFLHGANFSV